MMDVPLKYRVRLEQQEFQFDMCVPGGETVKALKMCFLESIQSRGSKDEMLLYLIRRLASYYLQKSVPICSQDKEGSRAYLPDDKKTSDDFKEVQAAVVKVRSTWGALTSPLALTPIVKEGGF